MGLESQSAERGWGLLTGHHQWSPLINRDLIGGPAKMVMGARWDKMGVCGGGGVSERIFRKCARIRAYVRVR